MKDPQKMMADAATLYYKKHYTQQEIAALLHISRQTVSKLIGEALDRGIVEITVHNPEVTCHRQEQRLCHTFGLKQAVVCTASGTDDILRQLATVKAAAAYLTPLLKRGHQQIAISWGRTVEQLITELERVEAADSTVFPLFGATDTERLCFSPNELARNMADKLACRVKNTWFPYLPDSGEDGALFRKTSYYRSMKELWNSADIALLGVGDTTVWELFKNTFGGTDNPDVVGDIATHFFTREGRFVPMYANGLCASVEDLQHAGLTVAVACGDSKIEALQGALRTGILDVLITDVYTAESL